MTVSKEIAAAQAAYAARPYAARIVTECFSGTFRFDTQAQAVEYLRQQIARHGFLQPGITNNWSNKGVRVYDSYVIMPDEGEIGLEDLGIAAQFEGPAGRWIMLDEGEVLERRIVAKPVATLSVPLELNGYPVVKSQVHGNGIVTVLVERAELEGGDRWIVATWARIMGDTWSWGHYCQDLPEAYEIFDVVARRNMMRGNIR